MNFSVKSTRREAPLKVLVYGDGGVGKSTFGAAAPKPIFLTAEEGLHNIDAVAVEPAPRTWADAIAALEYIAKLDYQTVVIDSLDWLEPLCWAHVCAKAKKADIEAFGFGKGYLAALDEWRVFLRRLDVLHEKGMHVILLAHAIVGTVKNPEGDDYDRWSIKLQDSKKCSAAGLMYEWCQVVAFAQKETSTYESNGRTKGISTGKRTLRVEGTAAYYAKTRFSMPRAVPLDWSEFFDAVKAGGAGAQARLRAELEAALAELGDDEVTEKARGFLGKRGESVASLTEALGTVKGYLAEKAKKAS